MNRLIDDIRRYADLIPNSPALAGESEALSYLELHSVLAATVAALPGAPREPVAIAMDNGIAWAVTDLALLSRRVPCLPVPQFFAESQQVHALRDAGARWLLTDRPSEYAALFSANGIVAARVNDIDVAGTPVACFALSQSTRVLPEQTAKITYTSGTTGEPKGVCLDESAMMAVALSLARAAEFAPNDRHFCILPLSTLLENIAGIYAPLKAGSCSVLLSVARTGITDGTRLAKNLKTLDASSAITVPEILLRLCAAIEQGVPRPDRLRFVAVGGARVAADALRRAQRAGLPVYEGYGLSECSSVVALNTRTAHRIGSVGHVLPHARVKIEADGEIHVAGATLLGYTSGGGSQPPWYATGDLGRFDDDGFLYITGRKKNIFITSYGRNVSPEWVESELTASAAIAQAWVYGEARPWNAAVIAAAGTTSDAAIERAIAAANRRLPDYARVARWMRAFEPFSAGNGQLTPNGRLRREALISRYAETLNQLYMENDCDVSR